MTLPLRMLVILDIKIIDYKSPFFLDFIAKDIEQQNFGALIESYVVHNALRDRVLQQKNVTIFCPNSYQDIAFSENSQDNLRLSDDKTKIKSDLLLAHGRFSEIRQKFDIATKVKKFGQTAIVFNIEHQQSHNDVAWEKFFGAAANFTAKDKNQSSIVWIVKDEIALPPCSF